MRRLRYFIVFLVLGILSISLFGNLTNASKNNVKIGFGVMSKFDSSEEVDVLISVNSGVDEKNVIGKLKNKEKAVKFSSGGFAAKITKEELDELIASGDLNYVEEVRTFDADLSDSVPLINASLIWPLRVNSINLTGTGQTICIVDTGVNFTHADLIGRNKTACTLDCIDKVCAENCSEDDWEGHGTHVAGIAGAVGTVNGVAINMSYISLKVFPGSGRVGATTVGIKNAIDWCVDNYQTYGISVISMSLGTATLYTSDCDSTWPFLNQSITNAFNKNISVVVSSGNDGSTTGISSPSCISTAIPVSATDKSDNIWSGSNRNSLVKLMAPGAAIYSTYNDGGYTTLWGTSMAAPHVSGSIALIRQYLDSEGLTKTPWEIEDALNSTGVFIDDSGGSGETFRRINVYEAINSFDNDAPNVSLISPLNNTEILVFNQTFRCNASDLNLNNLTFYLWNSSSLYNSTFFDIGGSDHTLEIEITGLDYGDYEWNCLYNDYIGNSDFASSNFSLSVIDLVVDLDSPVNGLKTNKNQSYNCSVNSTNELSNITLYIWNSSGSIEYNISEDISGFSNSSSFSYNLSSEGNYSWNCLAVTNLNNALFSSSNYSISYDLTPPNISIVTPVDSGWYSVGIFNVSLSEIGNCWYSLDNGLTNKTMTLSDSVNFTALNSTISDGLGYNITYYCNDSVGNVNMEFSTFNIDSTNPVVNLVSPADDYSVTGTTTINFKYNVTDDSNITGCSLILDSSSVASNDSEITSGTNTIAYSVSEGSYTWYIECNDKANNAGSSSSRNLEIAADGDGGGSSGGGGSTTILGMTYVTTKEMLIEGYSRELEEDDKIKMVLSILGNEEEHLLTVLSIGTDSAKVSIESEAVELDLVKGVAQKVDINSNGFYDLMVLLKSVSNNKAEIFVLSIFEEVIVDESIDSEVNETASGVNETVEGVNGTVTGESLEEVSEMRRDMLIALAIVVGLVIIVFIISWVRNRKKNKLLKIVENLFRK